MSLFAVRYTYDARTDLQGQVRPEHRAYLAARAEAGELLGSGPFADGAPGALLVLDVPDRERLDQLLADDPFARAGVIADVDVRAWDVVIGPWSQARPR